MQRETKGNQIGEVRGDQNGSPFRQCRMGVHTDFAEMPHLPYLPNGWPVRNPLLINRDAKRLIVAPQIAQTFLTASALMKIGLYLIGQIPAFC